MAIEEIVTKMRVMRAFMETTSPCSAFRDSRSSSYSGPRVLGHENRPDSMVGRLHQSLGPTLSAHFRWSVCASELLLTSTRVLVSGRTIWTPEYHGQYGTLPIPTTIRGLVAPVLAGPELSWRSARTARQRPRGRRWLGTGAIE